eukprot:TRINITY_DN3756_c0_g1_i17.p2 TRINITY_DN3756_c0_g1~~TRINITY_DN3756_c0_g1_i17.p2  ORF type:complete len:327 (-),score=39.94 TRINITY_DN3756_c0_g1_i17:56-1036(-)
MMHAKENPDPEDIQKQNELFDSYNKYLRTEIENEMTKLASEAPELDENSFKKFRASSFALQFNQLLIRGFKNYFRNDIRTWVAFFQMLFICFIVDIIFWKKGGYDYINVRSKNGALAGATTFHFLHSINSVLLTFPIERNLFLREQANRMYGVLPYYLSKMLVELPCQVILPILFCLITYWAIELRNETGPFFQFTAAILILAFVGNSIGILLGSMFGDPRMAIGIVPVLLCLTLGRRAAYSPLRWLHVQCRPNRVLAKVDAIHLPYALCDGDSFQGCVSSCRLFACRPPQQVSGGSVQLCPWNGMVLWDYGILCSWHQNCRIFLP